MKKITDPTWLYKGEDSKIFRGTEAIKKANDDGWVDCPNKARELDEKETFDYVGKTAEELADNLTVKELKAICKDLDITVPSKAKQAEICDLIVGFEE